MLCAALFLSACGGDDAPDTDGGLSAKELAAKLPEDGIPQVVAADITASKEAAGLDSDSDPTELGTNPEEVRFAVSAFTSFLSLSIRTDNPVRSALDHSLITASAAQPTTADDGVTLVSTSQDFEEIASSLEDADWERDGDLLTTEGDALELGYTAAAAGDGFLVLGNDPTLVEDVATGDAEPSQSGELEALEQLDAPVIGAIVPEIEGLECVSLVTFEDFVNGEATIDVTVDGEADPDGVSRRLKVDASSIGFTVSSVKADADTLTIELEGRDEEGLANSPTLLIASEFDQDGALLYDCP